MSGPPRARRFAWVRAFLPVACAALVAVGPDALADPRRTLRYAARGDVLDLDPHGNEEGHTNAIREAIYEGLVVRTAELELRPGLAESWTQVDPVTWRFRLRRGVRFHGGEPFTADDVVYSFRRVRLPSSGLSPHVATVKELRAVDDHTVDLVTSAPDPILLRNLVYFYVVSRKWAEANHALDPPVGVGLEVPTARRANGTGPFRLVERVPDTHIVLEANPDWWGRANPESNASRIEVRPIASSATRMAALLSGEVDFISPVPPQDVERIRSTRGFRVEERADIRTIFLGFDHFRDESLDMPGSGKNPFRDVRVRRAAAMAIDEGAIQQKVMRGAARPAGLLVGPGVEGYDASLDVRPPHDPEGAKRLLAEAGYASGFPVTLDCTNDRYVNDEAICQAVVSMLARVGIRVSLNAQTKSKAFAKMRANDTSFFMMGWAPGTADAREVFFAVAMLGAPGSGLWNFGRFRDARLESLMGKVEVEMDPVRRRAMISDGHRIVRDQVAFAPLHQQTVTAAMRIGVAVLLPRDGDPTPRFFRFAE